MEELTTFEDSDTGENYCPVCLLEHDEAIHAATLSIRAWWRRQVTQYFYEEQETENTAA